MMIKLAAKSIGEEFLLAPGRAIESVTAYQTLGGFISVILPNVYIIAGIILFGLLLFGGFSIIMGAGQDDPEKVKKGQKALTAAIIGFLTIFASYWIIQIISTLTGLEILRGAGL
jgi:hypothetical protein